MLIFVVNGAKKVRYLCFLLKFRPDFQNIFFFCNDFEGFFGQMFRKWFFAISWFLQPSVNILTGWVKLLTKLNFETNFGRFANKFSTDLESMNEQNKLKIQREIAIKSDFVDNLLWKDTWKAKLNPKLALKSISIETW